jgi:hypothetical protein
MIIDKTRVNEFFKKYYIQVLNEQNRRVINFSPNLKYSLDFDEQYMQNFETEKLLTISIPQSRLDRLVELEASFYNNIDSVGHRRHFEAWMDTQAHERNMREKHVGLKDAYDQYKMLLELCREKPKQFKDLPDQF